MDSMTVFRILRGSYMGWFYPILVAAAVIDLWRRVGRFIPPAPVPASRPPAGAAGPPFPG